MRYLLPLLALTSCGTYVGTEGVIYYGGLIEEGGNVIVGPEVIIAAASGLLGPFAAYIVPIGGVVGMLTTIFVTKRKKSKKRK